MRGNVRIGRIFGVDINVDWIWLLIFFLIAWNLGTSFALLHPEWRGVTIWSITIVAALLFFASVLVQDPD